MTKLQLQAVQIESGNRAALALMAQLHRRAFIEQDERPWNIKAFEQLLASQGCEAFLYYLEDSPVGFAFVRNVCDEAELISIAIDPVSQGQGFAKQVLKHLLKQLVSWGVYTLFLEVRQDNQKAVQLYRSVGFKKIGERKAYYQTLSGKRLDADVFSLAVRQ